MADYDATIREASRGSRLPPLSRAELAERPARPRLNGPTSLVSYQGAIPRGEAEEGRVELTCGQCRRVLEFSGQRPRFCGYCGRPLEAAPAMAETAMLPPADPGATQAAAVSVGGSDDPSEIGGY